MIKFSKWTIWINPYYSWFTFIKNISNSKKRAFDRNLYRIWFKIWFKYDSNSIVSWSEFAMCVFNKYWSVFSQSTIWVKPYCLWFKFLKDLWNRREVWHLNKNLKEFWKGQYGSNSFVPDTIFLITFWTPKKKKSTKKSMSFRWKFI